MLVDLGFKFKNLENIVHKMCKMADQTHCFNEFANNPF